MIIGINASKAATEKKTGIEWTVYELILALKKIDHKNTYHLYTNNPLPKELVSNNFQEKLIPFPKFWHRTRLPIELLKDNIEAYIEPSAELPTFAPKKSLVFIHDLAWFEFPEAYSRKEYLIQKRALRKAIANASRIVCVSKSTEEDVQAYDKKSKPKTVVIENGFRPESLSITDPSLSINDFTPYILSVGRLEERKNTQTLVESFNIFNERNGGKYNLVLAGKPGYGYRKIKASIENSAFADKIFELGYISQPDKALLLKNATIFAFISRYEGFGLPILESFSAGTPVVAANSSSLPEVAGDAAILVNPEETDEIVEAFQKIVDNPKMAKDLIEKGRERIKIFSWDNTARKILKCLEEM